MEESMKARKRGFTIVELMIVIVIIGILVAIIVPAVTGAIDKANLTKLQAEVKSMNTQLLIESIFDSVYAYRPEEVEEMLEGLGFDLGSTPKGYSLWYNQEKNEIILAKTEEMFAGGSSAVQAAFDYSRLPVRIEAVTANRNLLYIDKTPSDIRTYIDSMRNLMNDSVAGTAYETMSNVENRLAEIRNAVNSSSLSENIKKAVTDRLDTDFAPDTTLFVSDDYMINKKVLEAVAPVTVNINNILFQNGIKVVPKMENNMGVTIEADFIIEIPNSVAIVSAGAFNHLAEGCTLQVSSKTLLDNNSFIPGTIKISYVEDQYREISYLELGSDINISYSQAEVMLSGGRVEVITKINPEDKAKGYLSRYLIPSLAIEVGEGSRINNVSKLVSFVIRRQKFGNLTKIMAVAVIEKDGEMYGYKLDNIGYITNADAYTTRGDILCKAAGRWQYDQASKTGNPSFSLGFPSGITELANYKGAEVEIEYSVTATRMDKTMSQFGTPVYTVHKTDGEEKLISSGNKKSLVLGEDKVFEINVINDVIPYTDVEFVADGYYRFSVRVTQIVIKNGEEILFVRDF
jgi:prepilin-type N-terminal cleavage/methylation domain-containing protein